MTMSIASWKRDVLSIRSRDFSSERKRRAAKSKSPARTGPSESAKASSSASSSSPRSLRPPLPFPLPPLRSSRLSMPRSSPKASPKRSERAPKSIGGPRSRSPPKPPPKPPRSRSPPKPPPKPPPPPGPPFPLSSLPLPPWAKRTVILLPMQSLPFKLSAFCACSSVLNVTKQTPFDWPSSFFSTLRRSTSPTSSKNILMSSSARSPMPATKTCLGLGS
mmetsp:Transcript_156279/g.299624  ORF Transcript_156279/g.299624 Transcript_156279/m.299624 type:complete len:219 (+) Transcript_156279:429-1085(+)